MDIRYGTFLTLCELMNYRKTAEEMHLTQPAVTRQIQSLEDEFSTKFFIYDHHFLKKTSDADILQNYIISLRHNYGDLKEELERNRIKTLHVGATKTIGDYVIPGAVEQYLADGSRSLRLQIDNTEELISELRENKLDFALIEGIFDKSKYESRLLRQEKFTGICACTHPFAKKKVKFSDVFPETLIVREKGSGTRDILERELCEFGFSIEMFRRHSEISSFSMINRLISNGTGISFAYNSVIKDEDGIATFKVDGMNYRHEFNIVWLKHTILSEESENFLSLIEGGTVEDE